MTQEQIDELAKDYCKRMMGNGTDIDEINYCIADFKAGYAASPAYEKRDAKDAAKLAKNSWEKKEDMGETEFADEVDYTVGFVDGYLHPAAAPAYKGDENAFTPENQWIDGAVELFQWMNAIGGLGLNVHAKIKEILLIVPDRRHTPTQPKNENI